MITTIDVKAGPRLTGGDGAFQLAAIRSGPLPPRLPRTP